MTKGNKPQGEIRQSQLVTTFGPGSMMDLPNHSVLIAGHARLEAAHSLGMPLVPTIRLEHLNAAQKKALALADNKLGDLSSFDPDALADVRCASFSAVADSR